MSTTTNWSIEYPSGSTAPNVPVVMRAQAESVENALNSLQAIEAETLALGALYAPYGEGFGEPSITKDANGLVRLDGLIGIGVANITMDASTQYLIGTVPLGYRPSEDKVYIPPTSSAMGGSGRLFIRADGDIHFENSVTFTALIQASFFIGIDGFTWRAA
jgi:hypothetical protein